MRSFSASGLFPNRSRQQQDRDRPALDTQFPVISFSTENRWQRPLAHACRNLTVLHAQVNSIPQAALFAGGHDIELYVVATARTQTLSPV